ncbi:hypothetical protein [Caballeronia sordidicola]|nr:hypothetical protein [Caballeronia sordidicola]
MASPSFNRPDRSAWIRGPREDIPVASTLQQFVLARPFAVRTQMK